MFFYILSLLLLATNKSQAQTNSRLTITLVDEDLPSQSSTSHYSSATGFDLTEPFIGEETDEYHSHEVEEYDLFSTTTFAVKAYVELKDSIRNIGKTTPTLRQKNDYEKRIGALLEKMKVNKELKKAILNNVKEAPVLQDLTRTVQILEILEEYGLRGSVADQFFLGAHFKLDDQGRLFEILKFIRDERTGETMAEPRFSSHFADTRIEELGISAGRILPEVLFLQSKDREGITYSHVQAEASPWRMVSPWTIDNLIPDLQTLQNMEHIYDSLIYFVNKKIAEERSAIVYNRALYGWSPFADNNPIVSVDSLPILPELSEKYVTNVTKIVNTALEIFNRDCFTVLWKNGIDWNELYKDYNVMAPAFYLATNLLNYAITNQITRDTTKNLVSLGEKIFNNRAKFFAMSMLRKITSDSSFKKSIEALPLDQKIMGVSYFIAAAFLTVLLLKNNKKIHKFLHEKIDNELTNYLVKLIVSQFKSFSYDIIACLAIQHAQKTISPTLFTEGAMKAKDFATKKITAKFFQQPPSSAPVVASSQQGLSVTEQPLASVPVPVPVPVPAPAPALRT